MLTSEQAKKNQEKYGFNELTEGKKKSVLRIFLEQFKDFLVIILIVSAVISGILGDAESAIVIFVVITMNAVLGTIQTVKAEQSLDSLKQLSAPEAKVVRDDSVIQIPSREVTIGDEVILEAGDCIPADGKLIECASLKVDESALTGESISIEKNLDEVEEDAALGDQTNRVFSGSFVTYGRGRYEVTAIGMKTEVGKIADLMKNTSEKRTPLQVNLDDFGKKLSVLILAFSVVIFGVNVFQGESWGSAFMFAVALAVAAIPEALSSIVTIVLSFGTQKMAKEHAIIRKLQAVEGLGSVSIVCSDKTGTLTQNKMSVQKIWAAKNEVLDSESAFGEAENKLLTLFLLSGSAAMTSDSNVGNPTELAIARLAKEKLTEEPKEMKNYRKIHEIPFDSTRKLMTVVYETENGWLSVTKGAIDRIQMIPDDDLQGKILSVHDRFASQALRVIGVAYKKFDTTPELTPETLESDLTFGGLVGIIDPPREESARAVQIAKEAGIKTVMITGDHLATAKAIAEQIGILYGDKKIMNGSELRSISDDELAEIIEDYRVFARTSPEDKIRIVKAFQKAGEVVAMTGDGVNDAPALKAADVGIAMGSGTDVAKEAADMILLDDNFSTIVAAVEEGRRVYSNIRKSLYSMLGCNFSALTIVLLSLLFGWGSPVTALQILIIKFACDGIPGFSLCVEKADPDIMQRPPVKKGSSIFAGGLISKIVQITVVFTVATLIPVFAGQHFYLGGGIQPSFAVAQTMTFLVMGLTTVVHVYNCRSHLSVFRKGRGVNKLVIGTTLLGTVIMVLVAAVPPVARLFGLVPLGIGHWVIVFALSLLPLVYVEILKFTKHFKRI